MGKMTRDKTDMEYGEEKLVTSEQGMRRGKERNNDVERIKDEKGEKIMRRRRGGRRKEG